MDDDGDVVLASARIRKRDEPFRSRVRIVAARDDRRRDLIWLDVTRESVGAQHETIARAQLLDVDVGLHAARIADEARDAVRRDAAVVLGHLARRALAHEVGAAVAEICDHRLALADRGRDQRARRRRVAGRIGGAEDRGVRIADRVAEALCDRLRARRCEKARRELLHRRARSDFASGPAPNAIRDGQERHLALIANEVAIFVPFPNAAGVRPRRSALSHRSFC